GGRWNAGFELGGVGGTIEHQETHGFSLGLRAGGAMSEMRGFLASLGMTLVFEVVELGGGLFAVDHPRGSEAVEAHAEAVGPEGLLEGHDGAAVFGEGGEDALGFGGVVELDVDREGAGGLEAVGRDVGGHE